jgi:high affinity sulfate transporter 1
MSDLDTGLAKEGQTAGRGAGALPILQGVLPLDARGAGRELLAGITLAALAIPEVMGYARIAGMPVVTGLYTLLVPAALFAILGSSRHLVVGADSATAAIMAATLAGLAAPASPEWMHLAGALALLTAILLLAAWMARLAFLADFLSRTVLVGFLTGVGLQVALGQLPQTLGLRAPAGDGALQAAWDAMTRLPTAQFGNAALGAGVVGLIVLLRRLAPKLPASLIAVAASLVISGWLDLRHHGVSVIGAVAGGLPPVTWPGVATAWDHIGQLLPSAAAMAVVILAQSAATARAYAARYNEPLSASRDLAALGLANAGAALTATFVVNGSPTKTQMVDSAGGRSQLAHLAMAAVVLVVLLFFTGPLADLPSAALAGVVLLIGVELIHVGEMRRIFSVRRSEFWIAAATAAAVVLAGVERAIVLAMVLSLIDHVRRGYRPHNSVLVRGEDGHAKLEPAAVPREYAPGLLVYRFGHSMYYANADVLAREVSALAAAATPPLRWFVIDMDAVDDVDFSAGATLLALQNSLSQQRVELRFLRVAHPLLQQLRLYGLVRGEAETFASVREMRHRYEGPASADAAPRS